MNDRLEETIEERQRNCDHGLVFDEDKAIKMTSAQVQENYPRLFGVCSKGCGYNGIAYVSRMHYYAGDW